MAVNKIFFSYSFKDEEKVLKVREILEYSIIGTIVFCLRFSLALRLYALTSPPAPSLIPPKYLTTTHTIFVKLFFLKQSKIGIPDVPLGSPSSS